MQCPVCNGSGKVPILNARREFVDNICFTCTGQGVLPESHPLALLVRIEALEASLKAAGIPLYERKTEEEEKS